jgi:hypothetical protein
MRMVTRTAVTTTRTIPVARKAEGEIAISGTRLDMMNFDGEQRQIHARRLSKVITSSQRVLSVL